MIYGYTEKELEKTDPDGWRLIVEDTGRQRWKYLKTEEERRERPQTYMEKYFLGKNMDLPEQPAAKTPIESARKGFSFYKHLQTSDGNWACEYGGVMFLLPGLIIAMYISKIEFPDEMRIEVIRYLVNHANPEDGGWGIHIEGKSTVFGTALNYVVLRILGLGPDHPVTMKARIRLNELGGAIGCPQWGKFWLAVLNCYGWEGINPILPEFWMLPEWLPIHPSRWWVHTRAVYLPMGYIYGEKFTAPVDPLIESLREELYTQPYSSINFSKHRNTTSPVDVYVPHTRFLRVINSILTFYHTIFRFSWIKDMASKYAYKLIEYENKNTDFLCIGPVNFSIHILAVYWKEGPDSYAFKSHKERMADFLWISKKGMMMNGTNGVQLWDTSFAVQALVESGLAEDPEFKDHMIKALDFLDKCQIQKNCDDQQKCYRHRRKGAWPFSTRQQGYTVSDCTAEALKAVLLLQNLKSFPKRVSYDRLKDSVDVILSLQNKDGGFASYELIRGPSWLEFINPAEVFGDIMIEHSYPECTTAAVTALCYFRSLCSHYRGPEINKSVKNAIQFIKESQRPDGSWYESWAICFTYATMFALESLSCVKDFYENSFHSRRACDFLVNKQEEDGGWSEGYQSCTDGIWTRHPTGSQVVQTAWACIGLMYANYPDETPIKRGINLIMSRQQPNGEWKQEAIEGVFNKNCMISYPNYKFNFTIKALGMYSKRYGNI
uniref:Lanosterol synthase n=1 Tax=Pneumocystis carinii TaxID=4754 RepID=ERG7_PNECA|nr:RecName: Full=Lanosterol synthase; AltName: Full=2,3-epoxysqualene--lanosterol cyclase; AltName: Full=Oxidosqualene--lanosterol cyclase; Short=OSC [Pneumocystis carinii]AAK82993.1 lanosterol synthase [Pneumocystis carinii]